MISVEHQLLQARDARRAGETTLAQSIYRSILAADGNQLEAGNELAILCIEGGNLREAARLLLHACELTGWKNAVVRRNLVAALLQIASGGRGPFQLSDRGRQYRSARDAAASQSAGAAPRVSVVIAHQHDAAALKHSLDSVVHQTFGGIEILVANATETPLLAQLHNDDVNPSVALRHIDVGKSAVTAAINAGMSAATGEYVQLLFSRDRLAPEHVDRMVEQVAARKQALGFGHVTVVDNSNEAFDPFAGPLTFEATCSQAAIDWHETIGHAFIADNAAIAPGNLFVARDFFLKMGGVADLRHHYVWDFFLRAIGEQEPVYVAGADYRYCVDRANDQPAELEEKLREIVPVLTAFLERAFTQPCANVWAPNHYHWGPLFAARVLGSPVNVLISPVRMRRLVAELAR